MGLQFIIAHISKVLQVPDLQRSKGGTILDLVQRMFDLRWQFRFFAKVAIKLFCTFVDDSQRFSQLMRKAFNGLIKLLNLHLRLKETLLVCQITNINDDAFFAIKNDFIPLEANNFVAFKSFNLLPIHLGAQLFSLDWLVSGSVFVRLAKNLIRIAALGCR